MYAPWFCPPTNIPLNNDGGLYQPTLPGCAKNPFERTIGKITRDMALLLVQTSSKMGNQHLAKLKGPQDSWILQPPSVRIASEQRRSIPFQF